MNKYIISSVLVGVLAVGSLAFAEEGTSGSSPSISPKPTMKVQAREQKDQLRQDTKNARDNLKNEAEDARERLKKKAETRREQLKQKAEAMREDVKKHREEFNEAIKTKKEALKDEIEAKREKLKTNLEKIKDGRKKETVERIDQRMDALNEKMMEHFSNVLDKLEEMLVRIGERSDKVAAERGLDVSAVREVIEKAKTVIASARIALTTQSGKTYTIKITDEKSLKADVGKARQALGDDLAIVKDTVKATHSAVRDAAVALAQLADKNKISPSPDSTSSPQASPAQ